MAATYNPIWKDYSVTLGSGAAYDYEIRLDDSSGAIIYSGRVYKRPGASNVVVRVNDVCAAYLSEVLPALNVPAGFTGFAVQQTFCVRYYDGSWQTADTINFYKDWSYDYHFDPSVDPLAAPINGELDPRQHLIFSTLPASSLTAVLHFADGTTSSVVIQIARSADFNDDFNDDFSVQDTSERGGAAVLDLSPFTGLAAVSIGGVDYKVRDNICARYALYYMNAYGGWDSFIIDGTHRRVDALTRHTINEDYDNADMDARGRKDYVIEVAPAWVLHTGWLTDDQSERMHHLIESTDVYLCDLASGDVVPVVLTDAECEHKTYKGNGRQLNSYTINAQLAQQQYRR